MQKIALTDVAAQNLDFGCHPGHREPAESGPRIGAAGQEVTDTSGVPVAWVELRKGQPSEDGCPFLSLMDFDFPLT
jgi:hypothetical protein